MSFEVLRVGHLGDGIAEGPVYAPRTLPGEVITGELVGDTIAKPKIVTPSAERVKPPCPLYNSCGGCAGQHASDRFVQEWKLGVVRTALAAHGLPAPIRACHMSPLGARRRAKLSGRRTKSGAIVGFHGRGSHQLSDADRCLVVAPEQSLYLTKKEKTRVRLSIRRQI